MYKKKKRRRAEEEMVNVVVFHSCSRVMSVSAAAVAAAGAFGQWKLKPTDVRILLNSKETNKNLGPQDRF